MRATKAKELRRQVGHHPSGGGQLDEQKHKPKAVPTGNLNADGTQEVKVVTPVTRRLDRCSRLVYKAHKRSYKAA
jgi:hypothetical protein